MLFSRRMFIWLAIIIFGAGILLSSTNVVAAVSANKIKAAYIYQLTQFVTWPNASTPTNTALTICVFGNESINNELAPLNKRKKGGRLISVRHPKKIQDTKGCHILYIAQSKQRQMQTIVKRLLGQPILTVSSIPDFASNGGSIGFVIKKNKVRIEINRAPTLNTGIKFSAKLLEVAVRVIDIPAEKKQP